ncbi:hypothetical protein O181_013655 [Austropuccinia psidii MF-1]|uniref:Uncharacterized protein n=1 Tax=Austropuccinia psidii MF-1 TaxID=1389203 RepID=A0A9Q3C0B5_9BASI|nr:hypothetical protein [Austropuccinia psidii MF-1]
MLSGPFTTCPPTKNSFLWVSAHPQMLTRKPETHQFRLSTASYPLKYSAPMIPEAGSFRVWTHHCGSYARHQHTHRGTFGACLPANSHTFHPGIQVCVSPQEFLHTKKLMFGGMPP